MGSRTSYYNLALKEFNLGKANFTFVKKGTEEYDAVKAIEDRLKSEGIINKE